MRSVLTMWCAPQYTINDHNPMDMGNDRTSPIMENAWRCCLAPTDAHRPMHPACHAQPFLE